MQYTLPPIPHKIAEWVVHSASQTASEGQEPHNPADREVGATNLRIDS
jgi:hypothetical protein